MNFLGVTTGGYYAWWEWYTSYNPMPAQQIANFAIRPGDLVEGWIEMRGPGPLYTPWVQIQNFSTGQQVNWVVNQPLNSGFQGNSAEWIVERAHLSGGLSRLANYGAVNFDTLNAQSPPSPR